MKVDGGAIDQELSTDMTRCRDRRGCVGQRRHEASQEVQECAVVFRLDHVVHWQSPGTHRQCSAWLGHGGVADALSSVFSEEQCKVGCDSAGGVGVSVRHERCGEQSGDDGTEDQRD